MEDGAKCGYSLYWHNCYSGGFALWGDESYSHPAKMSPALCYRILQHLQELGLIKEGDTVLDPMAGIGTTNICAGAMGYKSISVELEEKFVKFQEQNKDYAERRLYKSLDWTMLKGDSRQLSQLLGGNGLKSVCSPPYSDGLSGKDKGWDKLAKDPTSNRYGRERHPSIGQEYSDNPDNIGNLPDKPLKSITSPPFWKPNSGEKRFKQDPRTNRAYDLDEDYGITEGQIGNLKDTPLKSIVSPPYEQSITGGKSGIEWQDEWGEPSESRQPSQDISYGDSKDNIGNLKDKPLKSIVSPPYQDSQGHPSLGSVNKDDWGKEGKDIVKRRGLTGEYGDADGQVGNLKSIMSPPYEEALPDGLDRKAAEKMVMAMYEKHGRTYSQEDFEYQVELILRRSNRDYGEADGQIGKLKDKPLKSIVSPPYGDVEKRDRSVEPSNQKERDYPRGDHNISVGYQGDSNNIGTLSDKPLKSVMPPPHGLGKGTGHKDNKRDTRPILKDRNVNLEYNDDNPNNIGNKVNESYLEAMLKVYSEIVKVSDVLTVVVKNPTRNGKLRRLDLDTIEILKQAGWKLHCQHRALLFEELEQADMFQGSKKQVKGRLSFFKRLSWQNGQPVASWEDILICVRL